jgi:enoyl-CoA hydratase/carnithine racemase
VTKYSDYRLLNVTTQYRIVRAIIDAPPINLMTLDLFRELIALSEEVANDGEALVLILQSANPDFFIAHFDVAAILSFPTESTPTHGEPNAFHLMCERFRTMNKVTIAQIEGRVGGGGSELSMAFDMRFGVRGKTILNQMEVPLGILPGGGGTQRLPRLVGRNRAIEVILGGDDLDADTAERWGYLNRALEASEINGFVTSLARRIASYPPEAVRLAKQAINSADKPLKEGLADESYLFQLLIRTPDARQSMAHFLEIGGQTRDGELRIGELSRNLGKTPGR